MTEDVTGKAKGGIARAQSLSPERRRQIAIDAARKRWTPPPGTPANAIPSEAGPELFAKLTGVLELGGSRARRVHFEQW